VTGDRLERDLGNALRRAVDFDPDVSAAHDRFIARSQPHLQRRRQAVVTTAAFVVSVVIAMSAVSAHRAHHVEVSAPPGPSTTAAASAAPPGGGEPAPGPTATALPATGGEPRAQSATMSPTTLAGRAPAAPPQPASESTTLAPGPSSKVPAARQPRTITVTEAQAGQTFTVVAGDHIVVELATTGGTWSDLSSSDEAVLQRTDTAVTAPHRTLAAFLAVAPGKTDVTSTETPRCRPSPPCMVAGRQFRVSVSVVAQGPEQP
jgi:hypothetical protein